MTTPKIPAGTGGFPAGLSQPALRALEAAGLTRLEHLRRKTEAEVAALHGMGPKGVTLLRQALAARGWDFKRSGKEAPKGSTGNKAPGAR
jgi:hypothetical protein